MRLTSLFAALTAVTAVGCADSAVNDDPENESFVSDGKGDAAGIREGTPEAFGVLQLVNYAPYDRLHETGISASALRNIEAHRKGADKLAWTSDDNGFDDLKELDDVKYVGKATFEMLLEYAQDAGFVTPSPYDGVCGDGLTSVQRLRDLSNGFGEELFGGAVWYRARACKDTACEPWAMTLKIAEPEDQWIEFVQPGGTELLFVPTLHRGYKVETDARTSIDAVWDIAWFVNVETDFAPLGVKRSSGAFNTRKGEERLMQVFDTSEATLTDSCLRTSGILKSDAGDGWHYEDEFTFLAQW